MSVEILLLVILGGITIIAYMVAINSHGPTKLSVSYILATLMLAGTVFVTVQHVNNNQDKRQMVKLKQLELEKQQAEERIKSQEQILKENIQRTEYAQKLNNIVNQAIGLSTTMINVDLRDFSLDLEGLMARAYKAEQKIGSVNKEFNAIKGTKPFFSESVDLVKSALEQLTSATTYYSLFYRSEDSAQEQLRDRLMRQRARKAYEQLKKASDLLAQGS